MGHALPRQRFEMLPDEIPGQDQEQYPHGDRRTRDEAIFLPDEEAKCCLTT
jgi:hypothetical protein